MRPRHFPLLHLGLLDELEVVLTKAHMTADLVDLVGWNVLRLNKSGRRLKVDLIGRRQKAAALSRVHLPRAAVRHSCSLKAISVRFKGKRGTHFGCITYRDTLGVPK